MEDGETPTSCLLLRSLDVASECPEGHVEEWLMEGSSCLLIDLVHVAHNPLTFATNPGLLCKERLTRDLFLKKTSDPASTNLTTAFVDFTP